MKTVAVSDNSIEHYTIILTKMAANLKRPELQLSGNTSENFKNFELRFNDFCIQAGYRDLDKDQETQRAEHYKKPLLEISALRSAMPDEALQVIRYTIEPQIPDDDKKKPWIWMQRLKTHYTGSSTSSMLTDRFKFWNNVQGTQESIQDWEVKVRQAGALCSYEALSDTMCRDKFIFGLRDSTIRTELLKTHLRADNTPKTMTDVVGEAKTLESAQRTNQLITDTTCKSTIEEEVNWNKDSCTRCGRKPHPRKQCPAVGEKCHKCGFDDHFAKMCLSQPTSRQYRGRARGRPMENARNQYSQNREYYKRGRARGRGRPIHLLQSQAEPARQVETCPEHHWEQENFDPEDQWDYDAEDWEKPLWCYSVTQSRRNNTTGKRYFTHLPLSSGGNTYQQTCYILEY